MNMKLLLCPNIPKPLHGVAPRVVLGQEWWDVERKKAYAAADFKCEACDTPKSLAWPKPWLEAHELYDYNYAVGTLKLIQLVALCPACHMFIHSGRLAMLLRDGEITLDLYAKIRTHGLALIKQAGLMDEYDERHDTPCHVKWGDWRMIINDKAYGPSSKSLEDWRAGAWRHFVCRVAASNTPTTKEPIA